MSVDDAQSREGRTQGPGVQPRAALWRQVRQIAVGLVVLAALLYAFGLFVRWGILEILTLEGETARVIFAGILGLVTALVVKSVAALLEQYFAGKAKLAERRREVYEEFIKLWFDVIWAYRAASGKGKEEAATREFARKLEQMTPRLMVWASDNVIRQFSGWKAGFGQAPMSVMLGLHHLICEVRKEVGHGASTLTPRELLGIFVTDADKHFA